MNSRLYNVTLQLLADRPRRLTLNKIAEDTKLNIGWLMDFGTRRIKEPSVFKVETLYTYLTGKPLDV